MRRSRAARAAPSDRQIRELGGSGSGPTLRPARGTVGAGSGRSDGATSVLGAPSRSASVRTDAPPIIAAMQSARVQSHRLSDVFSIAAMQSGMDAIRSEEHTSELQSLMRISYAVFCLKKKINKITQ